MSNLTITQIHPLNLPKDIEIDILRTFAKGKSSKEESSNHNTIRLVCKQWNEWSVDLLSTPELFRRLRIISPFAKSHEPYFQKLANRASKKLDHLAETLFLTKYLPSVQKKIRSLVEQKNTGIIMDRHLPLSGANGSELITVKKSKEDLECEIQRRTTLEQTIKAKLSKLSPSQETVNLPYPISNSQVDDKGEEFLASLRKTSSKSYAYPQTIEAMYSKDQTDMLLDTIKIERFDLLALTIIYRIPFDTEKIAVALLGAPDLHGIMYVGLLVKMDCIPKDFCCNQFCCNKYASLNTLLNKHCHKLPLIIRDFKFNDLSPKDFCFTCGFRADFLCLLRNQMFGSETLAAIPDDASLTMFTEIIPPGSLWGELNQSVLKVNPSLNRHKKIVLTDLWKSYQSPELERLLQAEPFSREKYKEIVVDFFCKIDFDNVTSIRDLQYLNHVEFLSFLEECIEEYRLRKLPAPVVLLPPPSQTSEICGIL